MVLAVPAFAAMFLLHPEMAPFVTSPRSHEDGREPRPGGRAARRDGRVRSTAARVAPAPRRHD